MAKRSGDGDDVDFANEMAKEGVVPLDRGSRTGKKSRQARRSTGPTQTAGARGGTAVGKPRWTRTKPEIPASVPAPTGRQTTERELDELRQALAAEREVLAAERKARDAAQRALTAERQTLETERTTSQDQRKTWDAERTALHAERKALQRQLTEARQAAETRIPLRDLLTARGCVNHQESIAVLRMLLDERPDDLLEAIVLASKRPLADLLEDRVALVAEGLDLDGFNAGSGCAVLRVPPGRCEIGGGSDIRTEFRRFLDAAHNAGMKRVTIVGGSPRYRNTLKNLAGPTQSDLRLDLVPGDRRRERHRAESDVRGSDLVVIWGATELDHSVSDVYTQNLDAPLLRVPHRGISRMLGHVAEALCKRQKRGKARSGDAPGEKNPGPHKKKRRRPKKR